ncbi:uncharacterized protein [Rutidosis leptorrhynchoides]|uniref:uncharacterized protein n=1 Tax=Rutidosis leptorrhynchoides TaxID=125765 RepID=UPI003A998DF4
MSAGEANINQTATESSTMNSINDPLYIASSDHPGMILTNAPFNGTNFLGWSRTVKMALGAKLKLGFIDGTNPKPAVTDDTYQRWTRYDYMVTCWILNSMTAELSEAFLYATSAYELWKEITERYGQSNGPLLYQLKRELNNVNQGNLSIASYFNKMKRYWDELQSLIGIPSCTCGRMRECICGLTEKFLQIENSSKLMQFLMNLNDDYESVRSQIISMDPLPSVNKAYYIVQQVEKQKQVTTTTVEPTAFFTQQKHSSYRGKNEPKVDKKHCTFCNEDGHLHEQCFERVGYPDWYKGKRNKKKPQRVAAQVHGLENYMVNETPFYLACENEVHTENKMAVDQRLVAAVCQEMIKMLQNKDTNATTNHAGISFCTYAYAMSCLEKSNHKSMIYDWIVDTGATDHMSPHLHLFHSITTLKNLSKLFCLMLNLLSVGRLLRSQKLIATFFSNMFIFQDLLTKKVVAGGKGFNNLYTCKAGPFLTSPVPISKSTTLHSASANKVVASIISLDGNLFHSRLGHTSMSKLVHIPVYKTLSNASPFCDTCVLAKHHRLPFPRSVISSKCAFELLHIDLWGPYRTPALNGENRDVIFKEDIFPFQSQTSNSNPNTHTTPFPCVSNSKIFDEDLADNHPTTYNTAPNTIHTNPTTSTPAQSSTSSPQNNTHDSHPPGNHNTSSIPQPTRKSTRTSNPPSWFKDFFVPTAKASSVHTTVSPIYPLFHTNDFAYMSKEYISYLANIMTAKDPITYAQASQSQGWIDAMAKEIEALEKNQTWTLTTLPEGCKAISSKWVYKTKYKVDGSVERLKARLVIKGFNQREGHDYKHTFSPVAKLATVRVLIVIATAKGWPFTN